MYSQQKAKATNKTSKHTIIQVEWPQTSLSIKEKVVWGKKRVRAEQTQTVIKKVGVAGQAKKKLFLRL